MSIRQGGDRRTLRAPSLEPCEPISSCQLVRDKLLVPANPADGCMCSDYELPLVHAVAACSARQKFLLSIAARPAPVPGRKLSQNWRHLVRHGGFPSKNQKPRLCTVVSRGVKCVSHALSSVGTRPISKNRRDYFKLRVANTPGTRNRFAPYVQGLQVC